MIFSRVLVYTALFALHKEQLDSSNVIISLDIYVIGGLTKAKSNRTVVCVNLLIE